MDPFELFDLTPGFFIDEEDLENTYLELIKKSHPDNFLSEIEKLQATFATVAINDAFAMLKNPLQRAKLLLERKNIDLEKKTPMDVLMEMIAIQGDENKIEEVLLQARFYYSKAYDDNDIQQMVYNFHRLQYLEKMQCSFKSHQKQ